jgi:hypothetical protein
MMIRTRVLLKLAALMAAGSALMASSCLPDNFWAGKWGEVINRGIFGVINAALDAATNGGVQI